MGLDRAKTKANVDKFVRANKIPEAIREVQKLVEDNPRDIATLQQLANLYLRAQNKDAAVPIFIRIAELYQKDGFTPKALASIKIALREAPDNTQAQELYASFAEQTGMQRDSIEAYEKLVASYSKSGLLDKAEKILDKLLELSPDSVRYQLQHGDLLIRLNKKEQAVPSYLKAAENLVNQGMIKESAKIFERVLQIDPKKLQVLEQLVKNLLAQKESRKAIDLLDGIVQGKQAPPIITELRVDILIALGDYAKAEEILKGFLDKSPLRGGLLGRFLRLQLGQKKYEEASSALRAEVEKAEAGSLKEFEAGFEEIINLAPNLGSAFSGLAEVYRKQGNKNKLLEILTRFSELLISSADYTAAREVLKEALSLTPNDNTLMLKLEDVEEKLGVKKKPLVQKPEVQATEEVVVIDDEDAGGKAGLPLDEPPEVEIEVEIEDISPQPVISPEEIDVTSTFAAPPAVEDDFSPAPGTGNEPEEMSISAGIMDDKEDELAEKEEAERLQETVSPDEPQPKPAARKLDAETAGKIQERLSEAQIFLKYGLVEKAIGELQAVIKDAPDHIQAHQKLIGIYRSLDKKDKLVRQILKLANVFREQGDKDTCDNLVDEAKQIDPNHKAINEFVDGTVKPKAPENIENMSDIDSFAQSLKSRRAAAMPAKEEPAQDILEEVPAVIEEQEKKEEDLVIEIGEPEHAAAAGPEKFIEVEESDEEAGLAAEKTPDEELASVIPALEEEESLHVEISPDEVSRGNELNEKLEEAEFYYAQELWDDAQRIVSELSEKYPADLRVQNILQRLESAGLKVEAREAAEGASQNEEAESATLNAIPDEQESSGESQDMSMIDKDLVKQLGGVVPAERKKSRVKVTLRDIIPGQEEKKEEKAIPQESGEEYYDLAKELGAALEGLEGSASDLFDEEEDAGKSPEEMSFEEVFKEFKKGVEKKVAEEDYDTHYNLGIAYKEMELVDEAIGEFQIAARSPIYFADACSMLGKCFQAKGMFDLSEKWYRKGLDSKGFSDEIYSGLRYDLAELLEEAGKTGEALALYKEVYAANANYREVREKIEALK
jgi:tetratricopeptide (TPR) repeat protein